MNKLPATLQKKNLMSSSAFSPVNSSALRPQISEMIVALEQRYIFDAAAAASGAGMAADIAAQETAQAQIDAGIIAAAADKDGTKAVSYQQELQLAALGSETEAAQNTAQNTTVVFVDADLGQGDLDVLRADLADSATLFLIDSRSDGLAQMAAALDNYGSIDAVHIVSHGSAGTLALGHADIDFNALGSAQQDALNRIGQRMNAGADLLIYGCDFGAGDLGRAAVESLHNMTGADIAASDDATGNVTQGGDWDLEIRVGLIATALAFSSEAQEQFTTVLSDWTPAQLSTSLWLDASDTSTLLDANGDAVTNGSAVSTWQDKSGNDNHAEQATAARRPTFSGGRVTFDGSDDHLQIANNGKLFVGEETIIIAYVQVDTTVTTRVGSIIGNFELDPAAHFNFEVQTGGKTRVFGNNKTIADASGDLRNDAGVVVLMQRSESNNFTKIFVNGTEQASRSAGDLDDVTFAARIGADFRGAGTNGSVDDHPINFEGEINDIVVVNGDSSDETRQRLEGWLAHKRGLENDLDSGNAFTDTTPQQVGVSVNDSDLMAGETAGVTIVLQDEKQDFSLGDITVNGGTVSDLVTVVAGFEYTATFTPDTDFENQAGIVVPGTQNVHDNLFAQVTSTNNGTSNIESSNSTNVDPDDEQAATSMSGSGGGHYRLIETSERGVLLDYTLADAQVFTQSEIEPRSGFEDRSSELKVEFLLGGTVVHTTTKGIGQKTISNVLADQVRLVFDDDATAGSTQFNYLKLGIKDASAFTTLDVDTKAPTIDSVSPDFGDVLNAVEDDEDATVTVDLSGVEDGQTVTLTLNGETYNGTVSSSQAAITISAAGLQGLTDGQSYTMTANVSDAAGNAANEVTSDSFVVRTSTQANISVTDSNLIGTETAEVYITLPQHDNDFSVNEIIASNGSITNFTVVSTGLEYTATFTPDNDYQGQASIAINSQTSYDNLFASVTSTNNGYDNVKSSSGGFKNPDSEQAATTPLGGGGGHYRLTDTSKRGVLLDYTLTEAQIFTQSQIIERTGYKPRAAELKVEFLNNGTVVHTTEKGLGLKAISDVTADQVRLVFDTDSGDGNNTQFNYLKLSTRDTATFLDVDTKVPKVTSITLDDDATATATNDNAPEFTVTFDGELGTDPAAADFTATFTPTGGSDSTVNVTSVTQVGTSNQYRVVVDGGSDTALDNANGTLAFALKTSGVTAADAAGNPASANGVSASITIDNTAPTITTITPSFGDALNAVEDNTAATVDISTSGVEAGQTVILTLNNKAHYGTVSSDQATITISAADLQNLAQGQQTMTVNASDAAGNAAAEASSNFTVDTVVPVINFIDTPSFGSTLNADETSTDATVDISTTGVEDGRVATLTLGGNDYTATIDTDQTSFTISAADLQALAQGQQTMTVNVSDAAGNAAAESTSSPFFVDTALPTVTSVVISNAAGIENNRLNVGDTVTATVTMGEAVQVNTNGGSPTLNLDVGGTSRQATWDADNSTALALLFTYTIQSGDNDNNGIGIVANSLNLNGSVINDSIGNDADLDHGAVTDNGDYIVDTTAPTITITPSFGSTLSAAEDDEDATVTVSTSGVEDDQDITLTLNNKTYSGTVSSDQATITISATDLQALDDGQQTMTASVSDAAGNAADAASSDFTVDTTAPVISTITPDFGSTLNAVEDNADTTVTVTTNGVEDDQEVTLTLNNKTYDGTISSDQATITISAADLQALSNGQNYTMTASVSDKAGNAADDIFAFAVDTVAPKIDGLSFLEATNDDAPAFNVTFDGALGTDPATDDFTATFTPTGGSASAVEVTSVTWSAVNNRYSVVVDGDDNDVLDNANGTLTFALKTSGVTAADAAGNPASTDKAPASVIIDNIVPTITTIAPNFGDVLNATEDDADATVTVSTTGVEDDQDITLTLNNKAHYGTVDNNQATITISKTDLQNLAQGQQTITVNVSDAAGNAADEAEQQFTYDKTPPAVTSITLDNGATATATNDNAPEFTVTFDGELGTDPAAADFTATFTPTNGSASTVNVTSVTQVGTSNQYRVVVDGGSDTALDNADGTLAFSLKTSGVVTAADAAGNPASANGVSASITIDNTAPTISPVTLDFGDVLNAAEDDAATTVSINTSGVENGQDITLTLNNKTYSGTVSSNQATITISATDLKALAQGQQTMTVNVSDKVGNAADEASSSFTVDTTAPTITITPDFGNVLSAAEDDEDATVTVTTDGVEDDQVVTLTLNGETYNGTVSNNKVDITISAAVLQGLTSGESYTITANVSDAAGNAATAASSNFNVNTTAPTIDSIAPNFGDVLSAAEDDEDATVTVSTSGVEDDQDITLTLNNKTYNGTVSSNQATITISKADLQALAEGEQTMTANVSDAAGNAADEAEQPFTYDKTQPTVTSITLDNDATATNSNAPEFTVTFDEALGTDPATTDFTATFTPTNGSASTVNVTSVTQVGTSNQYRVVVDGGSDTVLDDASGTLTFALNTSGVVTAADVAGNTVSANDVSASITIDNTAPTISPVTLDFGDVLNKAESEAGTTVTVTTDGVENGQTVTLTLGDETYDGTVSSNQATITISAAGLEALTSGESYTVTVNTSDAAGNAANAASSNFTVDTVAPYANGLAYDKDTNDNAPEFTVTFNEVLDTPPATTDFTATFTPTGGSDSTVNVTSVTQVGTSNQYRVVVDGGSDTALDNANGTLAFAFKTSGVVTAADAAGNSAYPMKVNGKNTISASITIDNTAPTISSTLDFGNVLNAAESNAGAAVNISTDGVEDGQKVTLRYFLEGGNDEAVYTDDGIVSGNKVDIPISAAGLAALASGQSYTVTANVSDAAGNAAAEATSNFTVDTVVPVINFIDTPSFGSTLNADETSTDATVDISTSEVENGRVATLTLGGNDYTATIDTDQTSFTISAADLQALAQGQQTITVNVSDAAGNAAAELTGSPFFVDTAPPAVTSVVISNAAGIENNRLNVGDTVTATVTMGEAVQVDTNGGSPTLNLDVGGTSRQATWDVNNSTALALLFTYTIQSGDNDNDGIGIAANSLNLNGSVINDFVGNDADLDHGAVTDNGDYIVDTELPTINTSSSVSNILPADLENNFDIVFSETISRGTGDIQIINTGDNGAVVFSTANTGTTSLEVSVSGNTLTFNPGNALAIDKPYAVVFKDNAIVDGAGNSYTTDHPFDTQRISARVEAVGDDDGGDDDGWLNANEIDDGGIKIVINDYEILDSSLKLELSEVKFTPGSGGQEIVLPSTSKITLDYDSTNSTSALHKYTAFIPVADFPTDLDEAQQYNIVATVIQKDADDHTERTHISPSLTLGVDETPPTVTSIALDNGTTATNSNAPELLVTFDEALGTDPVTTDFTATFTPDGGNEIQVNVASVTQVGTTNQYRVIVNGGDNAVLDDTSGMLAFALKTSGVTAADAAGNAATTATSSFTVDTSVPVINSITSNFGDALNAAEDDAAATVSINTTGVEDGQTVTLTLNGETYSGTVSGNQANITISADDLQALDEGQQTMTASVSDKVGNAATAVEKQFTYDKTPPATPTINDVTSDNIINSSEADSTITGTTEADKTVTLTLGTGNNRTATADSDGDWSYTLTADDITAMGQVEETISVTRTDTAGNVSVAASKTVTIDTVAPALSAENTITLTSGEVGNNSFTIDMTEAVKLSITEVQLVNQEDSNDTVTAAISANGNTLSVEPNGELAGGGKYKMTIATTELSDLNENAIADTLGQLISVSQVVVSTTLPVNNTLDLTDNSAGDVQLISDIDTLDSTANTLTAALLTFVDGLNLSAALNDRSLSDAQNTVTDNDGDLGRGNAIETIALRDSIAVDQAVQRVVDRVIARNINVEGANIQILDNSVETLLSNDALGRLLDELLEELQLPAQVSDTGDVTTAATAVDALTLAAAESAQNAGSDLLLDSPVARNTTTIEGFSGQLGRQAPSSLIQAASAA